MLYVAWTDGELTPEELRALGAAARSQRWLGLRSTAVLANWLDPLNPPSPSALAQVGEHIRRTAERLSHSGQKSLVELGAQLAEVIGGKDALPAPMPELARDLAPLETALGVSGAEAVRTLVPGPTLRAVKPAESHAFNVDAMHAVLERTYAAERASVREWLLALAHAHVERVVLEQFLLGVAAVEDPALKTVLGRLCDLYGLGCLQDASGWFLENNHLEGAKAKAIRKEVTRLCAELRPDAVALTKAFGIPDTCLAAPIALGKPSP